MTQVQMQHIRRADGNGGLRHAKRLHIHALPLALAVVGITGFLAFTVKVGQGSVLAQSLVQPAIGIGVRVVDDSRIQAVVQNAPVETGPAGAMDRMPEDGLDRLGLEENQNSSPMDLLFDANRSLAIHMAWDGPVRRR